MRLVTAPGRNCRNTPKHRVRTREDQHGQGVVRVGPRASPAVPPPAPGDNLATTAATAPAKRKEMPLVPHWSLRVGLVAGALGAEPCSPRAWAATPAGSSSPSTLDILQARTVRALVANETPARGAPNSTRSSQRPSWRPRRQDRRHRTTMDPGQPSWQKFNQGRPAQEPEPDRARDPGNRGRWRCRIRKGPPPKGRP